MKKIIILITMCLLLLVGCTPIESETTETVETVQTEDDLIEESDLADDLEQIEDDVEPIIDGDYQEEQEPMTERQVTKEELASHSNSDDCWIAYQGLVYDVTDFLVKHPGGAQAILRHCGTAEQFESAFSSQHGQGKVDTLMQEGIYIGTLI